jgi:hypothetical protein
VCGGDVVCWGFLGRFCPVWFAWGLVQLVAFCHAFFKVVARSFVLHCLAFCVILGSVLHPVLLVVLHVSFFFPSLFPSLARCCGRSGSPGLVRLAALLSWVAALLPAGCRCSARPGVRVQRFCLALSLQALCGSVGHAGAGGVPWLVCHPVSWLAVVALWSPAPRLLLLWSRSSAPCSRLAARCPWAAPPALIKQPFLSSLRWLPPASLCSPRSARLAPALGAARLSLLSVLLLLLALPFAGWLAARSRSLWSLGSRCAPAPRWLAVLLLCFFFQVAARSLWRVLLSRLASPFWFPALGWLLLPCSRFPLSALLLLVSRSGRLRLPSRRRSFSQARRVRSLRSGSRQLAPGGFAPIL